MLANLASLTLLVAAVAGQVAPNPLDIVSTFIQALQLGQPSASCGQSTACGPFIALVAPGSSAGNITAVLAGPYAPVNVANPAGQNAIVCNVAFVTAYEQCAVCAAPFAPNAGILGAVGSFVNACNANGFTGLNVVPLASNMPTAVPSTAPVTNTLSRTSTTTTTTTRVSTRVSSATGTVTATAATTGTVTATAATTGTVTATSASTVTGACPAPVTVTVTALSTVTVCSGVVVPPKPTTTLAAGASQLVGAGFATVILAAFVACL